MRQKEQPEIQLSVDEQALALLVPDLPSLEASDDFTVRLVGRSRDNPTDTCFHVAEVFSKLALAFYQQGLRLFLDAKAPAAVGKRVVD